VGGEIRLPRRFAPSTLGGLAMTVGVKRTAWSVVLSPGFPD